jgi:hypothetical protein
MSSDLNGDASSRSISGDTEVAGTPSITAPGASYPLGFRHSSGQNQNRSFSRPSGARLPVPTSLTETDERTNYQPRTQAPIRTKTGSTSRPQFNLKGIRRTFGVSAK